MNSSNEASGFAPWFQSFPELMRSIEEPILPGDGPGHWQTNMGLFRRFCGALPQWVSRPLFVKVGANDGLTGDPCSDLLVADRRWQGLLIEPVPWCFARLQSNFSDTDRFVLEQVAVGPGNSQATLYCVSEEARRVVPDLPQWADQLGSFDRQHILKHLNGILEPFIREMEVEVRSLSEILDRNHIRECHLLHIDTEGHDYQVLRTLDFSAIRPLAIFVEHKHLNAQEKAALCSLLGERGYTIGDCGGDYFALIQKN
jgi:FkbM family methyltransferase